ncbi:alpha/beta-hydrolase [Atractiella rhizophila]|nr:alpha/beta-hydrolase [Atractiella rhizophila]
MSSAEDFPRLHPELRQLYATVFAAGYPAPISSHPSQHLRLIPVPSDPIPSSIAKTENVEIPGGDGQPLRLVVVRPVNAGLEKVPAVMSLHSGGGVAFAPEFNFGVYSVFAQQGVAIVSVDYRLAPEHRLPASPKDAEAAWKYITSPDGAERLGIDTKKLGVLGSSFGGFLAVGLVHKLAQDKSAIKPKLVILDSPLLSDPTVPFAAEHGELKKYYSVWTTQNDADLSVHLDSSTATRKALTPLNTISKIAASSLPPHYISVAEFDSLSKGQMEYGFLLLEAGVPLDLKVWKGTVHIFPTIAAQLDIGKKAIMEWIEAFKLAITS